MNFINYFYTKFLIENPDELYNHKFSPFFTFFFIDDCVIYSTSEDYTHTNILEYLMYKNGNPNNNQSGLNYIRYQMTDAENQLHVIGTIPEKFVVWLKQIKGNVWTEYNKFDSFCMSGRVTKNHQPTRWMPEKCVMSFWQEESRLNQKNKNNINSLCDRLSIALDDCVFEFGQNNETIRRWDELEVVDSPSLDEKPINQVIHNISPELKGRMMKNMGIKPKTAVGVRDRFLRGESYEF